MDTVPAGCIDKPTYMVGVGGRWITFLPCLTTSTNTNDVQHRYCARCHRFVGEQWGDGESAGSQPKSE